MVRQGRICQGMNQDEVYLAWGYPNTPVVEGEKDGRHYIRWVYCQMEPVSENVFVGGGTYHCHHHGRHHHHDWIAPIWMDTSTTYVSREVADVVFENDKVVSWESRGAR